MWTRGVVEVVQLSANPCICTCGRGPGGGRQPQQLFRGERLTLGDGDTLQLHPSLPVRYRVRVGSADALREEVAAAAAAAAALDGGGTAGYAGARADTGKLTHSGRPVVCEPRPGGASATPIDGAAAQAAGDARKLEVSLDRGACRVSGSFRAGAGVKMGQKRRPPPRSGRKTPRLRKRQPTPKVWVTPDVGTGAAVDADADATAIGL